MRYKVTLFWGPDKDHCETNLVFEGFENFFIANLVHKEQPDGHIAMPVATVHRTETTLADHVTKFQFLKRNVPLAQ